MSKNTMHDDRKGARALGSTGTLPPREEVLPEKTKIDWKVPGGGILDIPHLQLRELTIAVTATPSPTMTSTTVHLVGTATETWILGGLDTPVDLDSFTWSLRFRPPFPPFRPWIDITAELKAANTMTPHFVASKEGTYEAVLDGKKGGLSATGMTVIVVHPRKERLHAKGQLTYLRVAEVGDVFGLFIDKLQAEVIIRLDGVDSEGVSTADKVFGFNLAQDANEITHRAMLDLLRDAYNHHLQVGIDYDILEGRHTGHIVRVDLCEGPNA